MLVLVKRWFPAGQISHWDSVFLATAAVVLTPIFAASFHLLSLFQLGEIAECLLFLFFSLFGCSMAIRQGLPGNKGKGRLHVCGIKMLLGSSRHSRDIGPESNIYCFSDFGFVFPPFTPPSPLVCFQGLGLT